MQSRLDSARAELVRRHQGLRDSPPSSDESGKEEEEEELASLRREFAQISVSVVKNKTISCSESRGVGEYLSSEFVMFTLTFLFINHSSG